MICAAALSPAWRSWAYGPTSLSWLSITSAARAAALRGSTTDRNCCPSGVRRWSDGLCRYRESSLAMRRTCCLCHASGKRDREARREEARRKTAVGGPDTRPPLADERAPSVGVLGAHRGARLPAG